MCIAMNGKCFFAQMETKRAGNLTASERGVIVEWVIEWVVS